MTEMKPVAWRDDGSTSSGSHGRTAFRVATDETKAAMPDAVASAFTEPLFTRAQLEAARAEERERCARLADKYPQRDPAEDGNGYWAAEEIAAAIRAGGS